MNFDIFVLVIEFLTGAFMIIHITSQKIVNYIFLGEFADGYDLAIDKALELNNFSKNDRQKGTQYIIKNDVKREAFTSFVRNIKDNKALLRIYSIFTPLLTTMIFLVPICFLEPAFTLTSVLMLVGIAAVSMLLSHNLRRKFVCIEDDVHNELKQSIIEHDKCKMDRLLNNPKINQNFHYKDYELVKVSIDNVNLPALKALITADIAYSGLERAFKYIEEKGVKGEVLHYIVGKILNRHRIMPTNYRVFPIGLSSQTIGSSFIVTP